MQLLMAPINPDILRLFHTLDIPLYEGYGMTKHCRCKFRIQEKIIIGTVGKPFSGTELMISDSGEILFRETYNERILQESRGDC